MTTIEDRIAEILQDHLLIRYDRRAWWCACGTDCMETEGSHSAHSATVLVAELGLTEETKFCDTELRRYVTAWEPTP